MQQTCWDQFGTQKRLRYRVNKIEQAIQAGQITVGFPYFVGYCGQTIFSQLVKR